jgi:hypothetical protein
MPVPQLFFFLKLVVDVESQDGDGLSLYHLLAFHPQAEAPSRSNRQIHLGITSTLFFGFATLLLRELVDL